jgi:hypothetical protein
MQDRTLDSTREMLDALSQLWISTVRDADPKVMGRVYAVTGDNKTAHGAVGGSNAAEAKSKAHEMLPDSADIVKIEQYTEEHIEHPLRD